MNATTLSTLLDRPPFGAGTACNPPERDYQLEALDLAAQSHRNGFRRLLLVGPTGSGKTWIFGALAWRFRRYGHRPDLLRLTRMPAEPGISSGARPNNSASTHDPPADANSPLLRPSYQQSPVRTAHRGRLRLTWQWVGRTYRVMFNAGGSCV